MQSADKPSNTETDVSTLDDLEFENSNKISNLFWCIYYRLKNLPHQIKWKLQRLFRGYSDADLWNLDIRLSEIILKHLIEFKKMKRMGHPILEDVVTSDEFEEIKKQYNNDPSQYSPILWELIIDKMIESFELTKNKFDADLPKTSEGKLDIKKLDETNQRIQQGLQLFAKYLPDLWD